MTQTFGDDVLERELRAVLRERAEEIAGRARSASEMSAVLAPRVLPGRRADRRRTLLRLLVVVLLFALMIGAIVVAGRSVRPPAQLLLAVDLPLQGEPAAPPIVDAVRLAIGQARLPASVVVEQPPAGVFDDSVAGSATADQGAENVRRIASDARYVALIGPFHSFVAGATIPIANAAGLLQCSASNTAPGLTIGAAAVSLRPRLDRPTYVRVASNDDAAATAAARLLVGALGRRTVFVVSTVQPWAGGRSETFVTAFESLGGSVVARGSIGDGGDAPQTVAEQIRASGADSVFFDGPAGDGAAVLDALPPGASALPFVGLDIILDGPRSATGSFLNVAGPAAAQAYGVFPAGTDPTLGPQVAAAYERAYGRAPGDFVFSGYACASVVLEAIGRIDGSRLAAPADWREAIRAEVTAPGRTFHTPVGTIGFDANGDATPQRVSIYRADPSTGDWAFWQMIEAQPGG